MNEGDVGPAVFADSKLVRRFCTRTFFTIVLHYYHSKEIVCNNSNMFSKLTSTIVLNIGPF